eukprot:12925753-Prorocentrum_lima.AAC.1
MPTPWTRNLQSNVAVDLGRPVCAVVRAETDIKEAGLRWTAYHILHLWAGKLFVPDSGLALRHAHT